MAYFPTPTNVFIANHEATNGLVADFSRNIGKFALPKYAQYVKVDDIKGFWVEMTVEQAGRVLDTTGMDVIWGDGNDQPDFNGQLESFTWQSYLAHRRVDGVVLGEQTVDMARWDILKQHAAGAAQRMMTRRTAIVTSLLTTTGNFLSAHLVNVDSPPSAISTIGNLDAATSSNKDIKRTLDYLFTAITKSTLGAVEQDDMMLVMNPNTAQKLSITSEIVDTLKQSPYAMGILENASLGGSSLSNGWGIGPKLYGYNVCVESTVKVTTAKGASTVTKDFVWPDGYIAMVSRPGALGSAVAGAPSFSSVSLFLKDEMLTETKHDVDNKRHISRIIDTYDAKITSQLSCGLIYNALT